MAIAASATGGFVRSADADNTVTWEKSPATVQVLACDPLSPLCPDTPVDLGGGVWQGGVVLTEIMNNQGDPHGLGGYQLNVLYDPWVFQDAEIADAGAIDDGGVRSTTCAPTPSSPGNVGIACTSTGPYGVGAVWSGPMVMAHVTLKLQPGVYYTIENGPSGGITTWVRDSIRVTNTCGQPLNDGTIQPLPGQQECQGNLLPGLGASGVVLSPGQSTVTVLPPPSTPTPTATQTATKTPTATHTATRTPTATGTAITTTATVTTVTPTGTRTPGTTTPTKTSTPAPSGTPTTPVTSTPGPTKTPGPCSRDREYWRDHPDDWPIDHLSIGGEDYNKAELLYVLWGDTSADPSIALAQELIAAKLNAAAGHPRPPADVVALGDTLLAEAGGRLPQHQDRTSYRGQGMLWVAGSLASHERDDDCESRPPSHTPTAVNTVLGSARPGEPSTLPQTGDPSTIGNKLRSRILTGAALVTVSVFVVVTRRLVRKRDD